MNTKHTSAARRFSGWSIAIMESPPTTEYVLAAEFDTIAAQRDALLAALRKTLPYLPDEGRAEIRAVIAKAEGT